MIAFLKLTPEISERIYRRNKSSWLWWYLLKAVRKMTKGMTLVNQDEHGNQFWQHQVTGQWMYRTFK